MKVMVTEFPDSRDKCPFIEYEKVFNSQLEDNVYIPMCKCTNQQCDFASKECSGLYKF